MAKRNKRKRRKRLLTAHQACAFAMAILERQYPSISPVDWSVLVYPRTINATSIDFDLAHETESSHIAIGIEKGIPDTEFERIKEVVYRFGIRKPSPVVVLKNVPPFHSRALTAGLN